MPIENLTQESVRIVQFVKILSTANQAEVTLLHVCDRRTSNARISWMKSQLELLVSRYFSQGHTNVSIVPADNVVSTIVKASQSSDLVVLRSRRRRLSIGQVAISDVTTEAVQQIRCSVILLGEPQGYQESLRKPRASVQIVTRD